MASSSHLFVLLIVSVLIFSQVSGIIFDDEGTLENRREKTGSRSRLQQEKRPGSRSRGGQGGCYNVFNDNICGEVIKRKFDCVLHGKKRVHKFARRFCKRLCGFC